MLDGETFVPGVGENGKIHPAGRGEPLGEGDSS